MQLLGQDGLCGGSLLCHRGQPLDASFAPSPEPPFSVVTMHSCVGTLRCPEMLSAVGAGGAVRRVRAPASVLGPPGRRACVIVRAGETARAVCRCVHALCAPLTPGGLPPQGNPGFSGERMSQAEMGEFGARDPTTTELDFGFQERVRGRARVVGETRPPQAWLVTLRGLTPAPPTPPGAVQRQHGAHHHDPLLRPQVPGPGQQKVGLWHRHLHSETSSGRQPS
jgi:hypothetical protein